MLHSCNRLLVLVEYLKSEWYLRGIQMIKGDAMFTSFLKMVVRCVLKLIYGNKFQRRKGLQEINFLKPKSEQIKYKQDKISA